MLDEIPEITQAAGRQGRIYGRAAGALRMPYAAPSGRDKGERETLRDSDHHPSPFPGIRGAGRRGVNGPSVLTLALVAMMLGWTLGSMYQTWTAHYRHIEAMTARYKAEQVWLDARTAEILGEMERHTTVVKAELNRNSKGGKKHGRQGNP
jgi:hypothetical protein